ARSSGREGQPCVGGGGDGVAGVGAGRLDRSGPWPAAVPAAIGKQGHLNVVAIAPSGVAVTLDSDRVARLWLPSGHSVPLTPSGPVNAAAFSSDGKLVVTAGQDGKARVWTRAGTLVRTIVAGENAINRASFSADGMFVVTAG